MQDIFDDIGFQKKLASYATESGERLDSIRSEAKEYLNELYTEQKPLISSLAVQGTQYLLSRAYDKTIDVDPSEMKRVTKLVRKYSVAFVMTHKTYIDMMVLGAVLARHGLPIPRIFAGINMSFLGVGQLGRKTGVIFIRRNIKENPLYRLVLRHFIASQVEQKADFMWAIEGTRSRTGKLVWPKMGILKYILDAERESGKPVKYVPVSTVYDLIPDVQDMTEEGRGKAKNPENLMWFVNYLRKMDEGFGRISLRFGEPVDMDEQFESELPNQPNAQEKKYILPRFAFELVHRINQITPVTTASLICTTLLSKFAQTKLNIESDVVELMGLIEAHKPDALVDRGKPIGESSQKALNLLKRAGLIQQLGDGIKAKYAIVARNFLPAMYYANMAVHHFYHRAFIEIALVRIANLPAQQRYLAFWEQIMELRDLFKFEFFYSVKPQFSDEIERDLNFMNPQWREMMIDDEVDILDLLRQQKILVSQAVLSTYVEAYRVVGRALQTLELTERYDEKKVLNQCLFLGDEMHWQGRIHRIESISKPLLVNGLRYAENQGLIPIKSDRKKKEIAGFLKQLRNVAGALKTLQGITLDMTETQVAVIPIERNIVPGSRTDS
ncbi:MAG: 1-acyl-sn-glycerol-3-phosphate acyltransferase, partial [Bacteroidota bacterium]